MLIDMHVHPMLYKEIYTPGDAPDGFDFWEREFGMGHMGPMDWDEIEVELDVCHVDKSVLMPLDVTSAAGGRFGTNDQIASLVAAHPDRLWGFASVDPGVPHAPEELERAFRDLGAKGLFLHPAKQGFCPGDASAQPLYEICEKYDRPVMFDAGLSWEPSAPLSACHPLAFEQTIMTHPNVRLSLIHI